MNFRRFTGVNLQSELFLSIYSGFINLKFISRYFSGMLYEWNFSLWIATWVLVEATWKFMKYLYFFPLFSCRVYLNIQRIQHRKYPWTSWQNAKKNFDVINIVRYKKGTRTLISRNNAIKKGGTWFLALSFYFQIFKPHCVLRSHFIHSIYL